MICICTIIWALRIIFNASWASETIVTSACSITSLCHFTAIFWAAARYLISTFVTSSIHISISTCTMSVVGSQGILVQFPHFTCCEQSVPLKPLWHKHTFEHILGWNNCVGIGNQACMLFNEFLCVFTSIAVNLPTHSHLPFLYTVVLTVAWTDTIYIKGGDLSNFAITVTSSQPAK